MTLNFGSNSANNFYFGEKEVKSIYFGEVKLYSSSNLIKWIQPVLTSNGTALTDQLALESSGSMGGYYPWKAFNKVTGINNYWLSDSSTISLDDVFTIPQWITMITKIPIIVKNIQFLNYDSLTMRQMKDFQILASNNNSDWTILGNFVNMNVSPNSAWNINVNSNTAYKYHKIYATSCLRGSGSGGYYIGADEITLDAYYTEIQQEIKSESI